MTDRQAALPFWKEYQHLVVQESPYTVLYYPQRTAAINRRLNGADMDIRGDFISVAKWWIAPAARRGPARPAAAAAESAKAKQ